MPRRGSSRQRARTAASTPPTPAGPSRIQTRYWLRRTPSSARRQRRQPRRSACAGHLSPLSPSAPSCTRSSPWISAASRWAAPSSGPIRAACTFADEIKREYDAHGLYSRTGCPVHPMYSPAKLRWYRAHQADVFRQAARFITIKEYVQADWLGPVPVDYSLASGSGLLDLSTCEWDAESLETAGIGPERLAPLVDTTAVIGALPAATAERLGLAPGCPVVSGAGDGPLSTLGTGCVEPGQYTAMVATSGAVRAVADQPVTDPQGRNWCYYLAEGRWIAGCAINNAGLAVRWLRDQVLAAPPPPGETAAGDPTVSADEVGRWAAAVPAGADGLIILPFLTGRAQPLLERGRSRCRVRPIAGAPSRASGARDAGGHRLPDAEHSRRPDRGCRPGGGGAGGRRLCRLARLDADCGRRARPAAAPAGNTGSVGARRCDAGDARYRPRGAVRRATAVRAGRGRLPPATGATCRPTAASTTSICASIGGSRTTSGRSPISRPPPSPPERLPRCKAGRSIPSPGACSGGLGKLTGVGTGQAVGTQHVTPVPRPAGWDVFPGT